LGPLFLRTSSYAHVWPRREQVLQLGLIPSHFNFLFLQIIHARRFGFGTLELPRAAGSWGSISAWTVGSDTMMVSDGEFDDDDDMLSSPEACAWGCQSSGTKRRPWNSALVNGLREEEDAARGGTQTSSQLLGRREGHTVHGRKSERQSCWRPNAVVKARRIGVSASAPVRV